MPKPAFTVDKRIEGNGRVTVYSPHGKINGQADCFTWLEEARETIQAGQKSVVLNLSDVDRIDSTGIGIIASLHVSATNASGKLCLTGLNEQQRHMFEATWLLRVIESADNEAAAIRGCAAD
jgi:anti-sigma B factor antagonist